MCHREEQGDAATSTRLLRSARNDKNAGVALALNCEAAKPLTQENELLPGGLIAVAGLDEVDAIWSLLPM